MECVGETDLSLTVLESVTNFSKLGKLLEVRSVGRSARVERVQFAEAGFKRSFYGASSSVDSSCLSLHRDVRVQRVNAALHENSHSCTRIHLCVPCMVCMIHAFGMVLL